MTGRRGSVLFISPAFFGYEREITTALQARGFDVDFVDERPSNSSIERAILRVQKACVSFRIADYYRRISLRIREKKYDLVLVVKGEVVPRSFLESLKATNPNACFIFYTFDSLANSPQCLQLLDLFDQCFSFDRKEVEQTGRFKYKPLFYTPCFGPPRDDAKPRFDVSFIGTLHSGRYAMVKRAFDAFSARHAFFYVPAPWYFFYGKYISREFANVARHDVSFEQLSKEQVADIFRTSRAVLDIQRSGQSGLTMRTFEVLASGAILITTNEQVMHEEFYDPARIIVLPGDQNDWNLRSIANRIASHSPAVGAPQGFERHSVANWVDELLIAV